MNMDDYVDEIEYAATHLIAAIWAEHKRHEGLEKRLKALEAQTDHGYERAQAIWANAEDLDDVMTGAGAYWESYFGVDKDRYYTTLTVDDLKQVLDLHEFSVACLSGSLLQYAKQGISIVHTGPRGCPDGRIVASAQNLKTVIWQGRNQAIHWEEGNLTPAVRACFDDLRDNVDTKFGAYHSHSLASRS